MSGPQTVREPRTAGSIALAVAAQPCTAFRAPWSCLTPPSDADDAAPSAEPLDDEWCRSCLARAAALAERERIAAGVTAEALAFAFIRIRGAHNPTNDEVVFNEEVRPCAWCRLAGEQAAVAISAIIGGQHDD